MRQLDLNLLRILDAVFRHGSVSAAAASLGMTQPGVSLSLKRLRSHFADELFVRQGGVMVPTVLAERLRDPVARALSIVGGEIAPAPHFDPRTSERRFVVSLSELGDLVFLPDLIAEAIRLNQYYTRPDVARDCVEVVRQHLDMACYQWIEPSAGSGAFLRLMPPGSRGYDLAPRSAGIERADFLTLELPRGRSLAFLGNPPFGKNAFKFRGAPHAVRAVLQIWVRRTAPRPLHLVETSHPDFEITPPDRGQFIIRRVGARAGRIHRDLAASRNSHYGIRSLARPWRTLQAVMATLDFASAASNVASNPSLAKSEIVALYRRRTGV